MENASKALIIAGSILVAIMIVAFGVLLFNKAQSSADTSGLDSAEITMFNQKWEKYDRQQLGSNVKALISYAISNASVNKDNGYKLPTITGAGTTATGGSTASSNISTYITSLNTIRNAIVSTTTYTVTLTYGTDGIITQITITT